MSATDNSKSGSAFFKTVVVLSLLLLAVLCAVLYLVPPISALTITLIDAFRTLSLATIAFGAGMLAIARDGHKHAWASWAAFILVLLSWVGLFLSPNLSISILLLSVCALGALTSLTSQRSVFSGYAMIATVMNAILHGAVLVRLIG